MPNFKPFLAELCLGVQGGDMCANQSLYEVLVTLIGMVWKKEVFNKLPLVGIITYKKTFQKILSYFLNAQLTMFDF